MNDELVVVVGLGYVGLPLAVEFGSVRKTIGLDLSSSRVAQCKDKNLPDSDVSDDAWSRAVYLQFTTEWSVIAEADYVIVAVPTPVDSANIPDFTALISASEQIGARMKAGAVVVYESTVYPGATEEICVPVLEECSGLVWQVDFHVGYSPERINPGDSVHTLSNITKVVSGDSQATLDKVAALYELVVSAGLHKASSIKVAEAAKVIENTQRDLNIALMNELAIVFDKLGINTAEVLSAAETKWNFLPFRPGLVGGHCIGVDPYYLTHKAQVSGYIPQVILAGRRINDGMASYIAKRIVQLLLNSGKFRSDDPVILLGLTFKENCSDVRNSKALDLFKRLKEYGLNVIGHDPLATYEEIGLAHDLHLSAWSDLPSNAAAIVLAVPHKFYLDLPKEKLFSLVKVGGLFADVKSVFERSLVREAGLIEWQL